MDERFSDAYISPKGYTPEDLQAAVNSEAWRSLAPNLHSPEHDLLPGDLDAGQIDAVVDALVADPAIANFQLDQRSTEAAAADASRTPVDLGEAGTLSFVGSGEAKICYSLERDGKKMAVLVHYYDSDVGLQIPSDPHLTTTHQGPTRRLWEYSDLRTYAVLPLTGNRAIRLQEFGEAGSGAASLAVSALAGAVVRRSATKYIAEHLPAADMGHQNTAEELQKGRHMLRKPGHLRPALIDVPVVEHIG